MDTDTRQPPKTIEELNQMIEFIRSKGYGFAFGTYERYEFTGNIYKGKYGRPNPSFTLINWNTSQSFDVHGKDLPTMIFNAYYIVWLANNG